MLATSWPASRRSGSLVPKCQEGPKTTLGRAGSARPGSKRILYSRATQPSNAPTRAAAGHETTQSAQPENRGWMARNGRLISEIQVPSHPPVWVHPGPRPRRTRNPGVVPELGVRQSPRMTGRRSGRASPRCSLPALTTRGGRTLHAAVVVVAHRAHGSRSSPVSVNAPPPAELYVRAMKLTLPSASPIAVQVGGLIRPVVPDHDLTGRVHGDRALVVVE